MGGRNPRPNGPWRLASCAFGSSGRKQCPNVVHPADSVNRYATALVCERIKRARLGSIDARYHRYHIGIRRFAQQVERLKFGATIGSLTNAFNSADELTSTSSETHYSYDEEGRRKEVAPDDGPATVYSYNQANNLTSISRSEAPSTQTVEDSYVYNGEGLRVAQTRSRSTSYLTWDTTEGVPVLLSDGARSFVYGPEESPIEQLTPEGSGEGVLYLHHDEGNSTRMLTSSTGAVDAAFTYSA